MKCQLLIPLLVVLAPATLRAEPSAEQIARQALDNTMFSSENSQATIELDVSKDGRLVRQRQLTAMVKRSRDGFIKSFVEFHQPADVAGTKFLSIEEQGETRQFIYLPAFKKVKRIVGAQRGQSFMGTDFSYSDLEGRDVGGWTWKLLPEQKVQGEAAWVIEGTPKTKSEQYGRLLLWVHKAHGIPLKSEFYDHSGKELVKRLEVQKLSKKDDRWITVDSVMTTPKKGTETRLKVVAIDLKSQIPDDRLTKEALER